MNELYRIHFGFSESKRYPQALELAKLAHHHEIRHEGESIWHIISFTEEQIDLMAALYKFAKHLPLPRPKVYGVEVSTLMFYCRNRNADYSYVPSYQNMIDQAGPVAERLRAETGKTFEELEDFLNENYWEPWIDDMTKVKEKLGKEGYIDSFDPVTGKRIRAKKKPEEYILQYKEIRELISNGQYKETVQKYYDTLGDRFYGEFYNELIYLKRLANIPLTGRDILYFRSESSRNELINSHFSEYSSCIDQVLEQYRKAGSKLPLDVIIENAPTMEELIEKRKQDRHLSVYLWDGEFKRDNTPVTIDSFSTDFDKCPEGRFFDRYPDQIQHCRVIEAPEDQEYAGLWTTYSPSYYQKQILDKGLHLKGIEAYQHKLWKRRRKEPDFTTVTSLSEIEKSYFGTNGIRYSGRSHKISGKEFYEIDLQRKNADLAEDLGNPFIELVKEILREAENLLRKNHGLPRIGEGWFSEMQLYNLVKTIFHEAQHHVTPKWLRPQHLDVFVPSKKLAFEYQGKQHFEPVDFFGGEESFKRTKKLDTRKMKKCKSNGISLIYWRYDEPINRKVFAEKLRQAKTSV